MIGMEVTSHANHTCTLKVASERSERYIRFDMRAAHLTGHVSKGGHSNFNYGSQLRLEMFDRRVSKS